MKDVLTPQATLLNPFPLSASANGDFSPLTPIQQGQRLARRSAAMVGLAVSMGATSFLFAQTATATDGSSLSPLMSLNNLPAESTPNPESEAPLAAPSVKHKVQAGESLWQIGQTFQVPPSAIAAANQIKGETSLSTGQSLIIPSSPAATTVSTTQSIAVLPTVVDPTPSVTVMNSVKALDTPGNSPTVLVPPRALTAAKASVIKPEGQAAIADVSRPIQVIPAEDQAAVTSIENAAKGVGIEVNPARAIATPAQVTAAAYSDEPISIAVSYTHLTLPTKRIV